jgi:hypothetical protein
VIFLKTLGDELDTDIAPNDNEWCYVTDNCLPFSTPCPSGSIPDINIALAMIKPAF